MGFWDTLGSAALVPFRTLGGLASQASVVPEVLYSAVRDEPIRRIPMMTTRITAEDIVWTLFVGYMHHQIQLVAQQAIDDAEPGAGWFSIYTLMQMGLYVMAGLAFAYTNVRKPLQEVVRTKVLSMEAGRTLVAIGDRGTVLRHVSKNPSAMSPAELRELVENNPAYLRHSDLAFHVDRTGRLELLAPANPVLFKKQFPSKKDESVIATGRQMQAISEATKRHHTHLGMTLCEEEKCSGIVSSALSQISFAMSSGVTWALGVTGNVGHYVATGLSLSVYARFSFLFLQYMSETMTVIANGRLVFESSIPELCAEHRMAYLREYVEQALSLGLSHWALSELAIRSIESATGWPRVLYEAAVRQFMLLFSISIAAHMPKAPAVKTSERHADPFAACQGLTDIAFRIIVAGAGKILPPLFRDRPEGPSLADWVRGAQRLWGHPLARPFEMLFVPRMLRSKTAFTTDPVIAPSWEVVRKILIHVMTVIEEIRCRPDVQVASLAPETTALIAKKVFGLPEGLVKNLLLLLRKDEAMQACRDFRDYLYGMSRYEKGELDLIIDLTLTPLLEAGERPLREILDRPEDPQAAAANLLMQQDILQTGSSSAPASSSETAAIILGQEKGLTFFSALSDKTPKPSGQDLILGDRKLTKGRGIFADEKPAPASVRQRRSGADLILNG